MEYHIAVIGGDGVGPEVVRSACQVLNVVGSRFAHHFHFKEYLVGGCAIDAVGVPLPPETLDGCKDSDSVLLGAVGGPRWDSLPSYLRPEQALLGLRSALELYCNLRPVRLYRSLKQASPLHPRIVDEGFDIMIVRELTGGIYFGKRGRRMLSSGNGEVAFDTESYSSSEIERIGKVAFETALKRSCRVTSVDKANILESSRLWRETIHRLGEEYPQVELKDMLVDNAAMQLIRNPAQFDVIVTSNMFGDILSDEASQLSGSIGLLPSSSLGDSMVGLYEPIHGSAPDIAGRDVANPIATILSAAMMLRHSFDLAVEANCIEQAVERVLDDGCRTADIAGRSTKHILGTVKMTDEICKRI